MKLVFKNDGTKMPDNVICHFVNGNKDKIRKVNKMAVLLDDQQNRKIRSYVDVIHVIPG